MLMTSLVPYLISQNQRDNITSGFWLVEIQRGLSYLAILTLEKHVLIETEEAAIIVM